MNPELWTIEESTILVYSCEKCGTKYTTKKAMELHEKQHKKDEELRGIQMEEIKESEAIGYKIIPGSKTRELDPFGDLTRDVCVKCLQPTDKKIYEIVKRSKIDIDRNTVCDRCFRYLDTGKVNDDLYEHVIRKDLVAFYREK